MKTIFCKICGVGEPSPDIEEGKGNEENNSEQEKIRSKGK